MSDPTPLKLRVHASIDEIPRASWDALVSAAADPDAGPFVEWTWLWALERSRSICPETGWHPRHFTLWQGSRLVAAAPAYLKDDSHGEFVFDWSWATAAERSGLRYYPKLILAVPVTPATGSRLLVAPGEDRPARQAELVRGILDYARSEELSSVHVHFPTEAEWRLLGGLGFAQRLGVQYHWHRKGEHTPEEYLARFRSKRRTQLLRERRAPAEQGIEVRTLRGDALSAVDPEVAFRVYSSTVDKYLWGRRLLNQDFFTRVLENFRHRLEYVEATRKGALVAGAFNVASEKVLYGRYWGQLESHPFLHFNVCFYHSIDECLARGLDRFEPGAGGEHKLVRGFEPALTYSAHWMFHPAFDRAVREDVAQEARAIREGLPSWAKDTGYKEP